VLLSHSGFSNSSPEATLKWKHDRKIFIKRIKSNLNILLSVEKKILLSKTKVHNIGKESNLPQCTMIYCTVAHFNMQLRACMRTQKSWNCFQLFHMRTASCFPLSFYFLCCHLIRRFIHNNNKRWKRVAGVGAKYRGKNYSYICRKVA
jgi:hypothetical protein